MMARKLGQDIRAGNLSVDRIAGAPLKRGQAVYFDGSGKVHASTGQETSE